MPRSLGLRAACVVAAAALAVAARAAEPTWLPTLDEGLAAAKASGRPVFLVTIWKTGV